MKKKLAIIIIGLIYILNISVTAYAFGGTDEGSTGNTEVTNKSGNVKNNGDSSVTMEGQNTSNNSDTNKDTSGNNNQNPSSDTNAYEGDAGIPGEDTSTENAEGVLHPGEIIDPTQWEIDEGWIWDPEEWGNTL